MADAHILIPAGQIHLFGQLCQILHLMLIPLGSAVNGNGLPFIQKSVAGRAIRNSAAHILCFIHKPLRRCYARSQEHRFCFVQLIFRQQAELILHRQDIRDHFVDALKPQGLGVLPEPLIQVTAFDQAHTGVIRDLL